MMDQALVNWLLAGFGGLIGFLLNVVWQAVKDLQKADKVLAERVGVIGHSLASGAAASMVRMNRAAYAVVDSRWSSPSPVTLPTLTVFS